jgi:hypothetical protein
LCVIIFYVDSAAELWERLLATKGAYTSERKTMRGGRGKTAKIDQPRFTPNTNMGSDFAYLPAFILMPFLHKPTVFSPVSDFSTSFFIAAGN